MRRFPPRLVAISDRAALARARPGLTVEDWAAELDAIGVDAIQLREKGIPDRLLFELAVRVRQRFRGLLLVNGRVDVAIPAGADGVHLPESGLPVDHLRRRFGSKLILGRSVHSIEGVREARRGGADYVTLSPIYDSPAKGPTLGPTALEAAKGEGIPILALGGIDVDTLAEIHTRGACGVAAIRLFQDPERARRAVKVARALWGRAPVPGPARPA